MFQPRPVLLSFDCHSAAPCQFPGDIAAWLFFLFSFTQFSVPFPEPDPRVARKLPHEIHVPPLQPTFPQYSRQQRKLPFHLVLIPFFPSLIHLQAHQIPGTRSYLRFHLPPYTFHFFRKCQLFLSSVFKDIIYISEPSPHRLHLGAITFSSTLRQLM